MIPALQITVTSALGDNPFVS